MDAEFIVRSLGRYQRRDNGEYMACCPAHNDKNPSLSVAIKDGKLLVHCFAGCSQEAVVDALKSRGLWDIDKEPVTLSIVKGWPWTSIVPAPAEAPQQLPLHFKYGKPSAVWRYLSAGGDLLQFVCRFDTEAGKQILPLTYCNNGDQRAWRWQGLSEPRPLYGLETLGNSDQVLIVEGEKATDAARRLIGPELPVLSWQGGSNAVKKADWSPLAGKRVSIWPDADEPGTKAALALIGCLHLIGCGVMVVELPAQYVDGWDLADAEEEGWKREEVLNCISLSITASEYQKKLHLRNAPEVTNAQERGPLIDVVLGSDIQPEPIDWLWQGWLAAGKLHILAGAPGTGKTTLVISLAAKLTLADEWPDKLKIPHAEVAIWSGEDDLKDTLAPRFIAAGAAMNRVHFVRGISLGEGKRPFDPSTDMPALQNYLSCHPNIKLLIVDPVVSAISGDSHKNTEVRRNLQPLVDLGQACGCAICGITHFSKGSSGKDPVERVAGSIAFGALARIVLATARVQDDSLPEETRLLVRAKSNIGPDGGGWQYRVEQTELEKYRGVFTSSLIWGDEVEGSARELLAAADSVDDGSVSAIDEAKRFLLAELACGPAAVKILMAKSRGAGIAEKTLRRAQKALSIKAVKGGMDMGWQWELPSKLAKNCEDTHRKKVANFGGCDHLREDLFEG